MSTCSRVISSRCNSWSSGHDAIIPTQPAFPKRMSRTAACDLFRRVTYQCSGDPYEHPSVVLFRTQTAVRLVCIAYPPLCPRLCLALSTLSQAVP